MGFVIWQRESSFCIRKEYFAGLVKAAIQRFPDLFDEMSSVRDIFKEFDFEVDKDAEGNLSDIVFTGEKTRYEEEFFETLAPWRQVLLYPSTGRTTASGATASMASNADTKHRCLSSRKI